MSPAPGPGPLVDSIESSRLVLPGTAGVLLLSGGADSCALAFGLAGLSFHSEFCALHLNYGLRAESGEDEAAAVALCQMLGIELIVERPVRPAGETGNLHAWAREERYRAAELLRARRDLDWIAVAHTASDLAETVVYRLAVSPGSRPLVAMPARRGAVIRPLLTLSREQVRAESEAAGLPFVDDRSNDDPAFARARIRNEVLPVLADLNPSVLQAISRTRDDLAEEIDFLMKSAAGLITEGLGGVPQIELSRLEEAHPALRRFALRALAEQALERPVSISREQTADISRLAASPEGGRIDLGQGASMAAESGTVAVEPGGGSPEDFSSGSAETTELEYPGRVEWGSWTILAEVMEPPFEPEGLQVATLDADRLGPLLEIRGWRTGDRIAPLGMGGSKSLQDLFTDSRVPRSRRRALPLLVSQGEIAWIPGLAVGERFRLTPETKRAIRFKVEPAPGSPAIPALD
ncbi:MAG: tRNA lysidine(34) synthetase TilS [Solirubrobacterales bacterium]